MSNLFIKCAGGEQLGIKRYWGDSSWAIFKDFVLIVVAQLESSTGGGGAGNIYRFPARIKSRN